MNDKKNCIATLPLIWGSFVSICICRVRTVWIQDIKDEDKDKEGGEEPIEVKKILRMRETDEMKFVFKHIAC